MNIYTLKGNHHIGKRYAAGVWCWDCKIKANFDHVGKFYFCVKCQKRCSLETLSYNPAMRELGFDKSPPTRPTGINGGSGFIWAVGDTGIGKSAAEIRARIKKRKGLKTEYGEKWTPQQFEDMFYQVIEESESDNDFC